MLTPDIASLYTILLQNVYNVFVICSIEISLHRKYKSQSCCPFKQMMTCLAKVSVKVLEWSAETKTKDKDSYKIS